VARGVAAMWCWCWALWQYLGPAKRRYLIVRRSRYIKGIHHAMIADDIGETIVEESVPVGEKQRGWRGVRHALTARWQVRRGRDE
jgi:hypothetical protein